MQKSQDSNIMKQIILTILTLALCITFTLSNTDYTSAKLSLKTFSASNNKKTTQNTPSTFFSNYKWKNNKNHKENFGIIKKFEGKTIGKTNCGYPVGGGKEIEIVNLRPNAETGTYTIMSDLKSYRNDPSIRSDDVSVDFQLPGINIGPIGLPSKDIKIIEIPDIEEAYLIPIVNSETQQTYSEGVWRTIENVLVYRGDEMIQTSPSDGGLIYTKYCYWLESHKNNQGEVIENIWHVFLK